MQSEFFSSILNILSCLENVSDNIEAEVFALYCGNPRNKEELADLAKQVSTLQDGISTIKKLLKVVEE